MSSKTLNKLLHIFGSYTEIGRICNISRQAVTCWGKNGVPPRHVVCLEKASGYKITRHQLRPDLYPRD